MNQLGRSSCRGSVVNESDKVLGSIPGLAQWVKDPALLWLWCRLAATAPIRPLAWKPPYAMGVALEKKKTKRPKKRRRINGGVPVVAQQVKTQLISTRMRV